MIVARPPNPRPAYSWPKFQVRFPPEMLELLRAYSTLVEVKPGVVLRALVRSQLRAVFGRGVTLEDALLRIKSLDVESRQVLVVKIKEEFEKLVV